MFKQNHIKCCQLPLTSNSHVLVSQCSHITQTTEDSRSYGPDTSLDPWHTLLSLVFQTEDNSMRQSLQEQLQSHQTEEAEQKFAQPRKHVVSEINRSDILP